ncbi:hypothetical protein GYMLUDRAFT_86784 [Collybiopsis luxurians FD-317 M1]|uniref:Uncharacterized protein n=1 Tax=Collybiopsis luxurians FD-317 M1 TaxID=944289 RepID=A0A0D0CH97_9AGAR|nr:hypothetical protein GYMLUDRAFT_86784 [Collybiopsis luxurians FD-317 M1]
MAKLSIIALTVMALCATNTMALPRHYNLRDVDIHAGPSTPTIASVTATAGATPATPTHTGDVHHVPMNATHPHNGTFHGPHNGTHLHHNGTHIPHGPKNGTHPHHETKNGTHSGEKPRIGVTKLPPSSSQNPEKGSDVMQINGNTFSSGTKLNETSSNENANGTYHADNSTLEIKGAGSGEMKLGGNVLPGGSTVNETDNLENETANQSQSSSSLQVS